MKETKDERKTGKLKKTRNYFGNAKFCHTRWPLKGLEHRQVKQSCQGGLTRRRKEGRDAFRSAQRREKKRRQMKGWGVQGGGGQKLSAQTEGAYKEKKRAGKSLSAQKGAQGQIIEAQRRMSDW